MPPRKSLATREPSGKVQRGPATELISPTELRRLVDAAKLGLKDPQWGSMLGYLVLTQRISASQYAAGRKWSALAFDYAQAVAAPRPPGAVSLQAGRGGSADPDPDSYEGRKAARRAAAVVKGYLDGRATLQALGGPASRAVVDVCEHDLAPVGVYDMAALQTGLTGLAKLWERERK